MIDLDCFISWAEHTFVDVQRQGNEVLINSPFVDGDTGHHLWANPSKNAYHCWKSNAHGNLWELVCQVDKCTFEQAQDALGGDFILRRLEEKLRKMYQKKRQLAAKQPKIVLPEHTVVIDGASAWWQRRASSYLGSRKLLANGLMVCTEGQYRNRIVIPYYDRQGQLIYFNTRYMGESKLRYLGPSKEVGVGKSDVLWMKTWPKPGDKVYLTEGEFDAMSLNQCGFLAGAWGGKEISIEQIKLIHGQHVVICFDQDKSGKNALHKMGVKLISNHIPKVSYVRPAEGFKDWNAMLIKLEPAVIAEYVHHNERKFQLSTVADLQNNIKKDNYEKPNQ